MTAKEREQTKYIKEARDGSFTFHIDTGDLIAKITRLPLGEQVRRRGLLNDGYSTLHYELETDSQVEFQLTCDDQRIMKWQSYLAKGAYRIKLEAGTEPSPGSFPLLNRLRVLPGKPN